MHRERLRAIDLTDDLVAQIERIVREVIGPDRLATEFGPDTPLSDGGLWLDSVQLFEILLACEQQFGRVFEGDWDNLATSFQSARTLAARIRERRRSESGAPTGPEGPTR